MIGWIVLGLIVWYIFYYYKHPKEVTIIQTILPNFKFNLLLEKQPIVLQDRVTDLAALKSMWFPYMSTLHTWTSQDAWDTNKHKYLVLQPQSDVTVYLYPRGKPMVRHGDGDNIPDPTQTLIEIKLQAHQVLIIPYKYHYHVEENGITFHAIACDDLLTRILP